MKHVVFLALMVATSIIACNKTTNTYTPDCSGTAPSFKTDVLPLITGSCNTNSGCHASGSHEGPGALTTYTSISSAKVSIRSSVVNATMPQNSTLTSAQKNTIVCWIDNGAANN